MVKDTGAGYPRAVNSDDKPVKAPAKRGRPRGPARPKTITAAAAKGTTRDLLVAMRARVAMAVEDETTPARDLASLTKRLTDIQKDIAALDAQDAQSKAVKRDAGTGGIDTSFSIEAL